MMNKSFQKLLVAVVCLLFTLVACQPSADGENGYPVQDSKQSKADSSAFATFDAVDAIEIVESPATGVALGWGWNRGDSEPIPTICVEFVPGEEPAQTRYMTMSEVNDSYELMQSLGMSAEASVKAIGFEAEGKASFAKSQNLTSSKSHFVMNAIVQNGVRYTSPLPSENSLVSKYQSATNERGGSSGSIRLTDKAAKIARRGIDKFRRLCGSSFVSAIYGGAKLTAMISMESSSKVVKERLSAEMSGSGWGVKVKAKVAAAAENKEDHEQMDVAIFMTGGRGDTIPATVQDLKAKLETISMDAYVAPKDFQIAITPYELLSNWPGRPLPDKETEFEELASFWGAYNTLYDDIQHILDEPEKYVVLRDHGKTEEMKIFCTEEWIKKIRVAFEECQFKNNDSSDYMFLQMGKTASGRIKQLKNAQDEVLSSLKQMEVDARGCSDKSDQCNFDINNYRSPYAYRLQLPIPINSGIDNIHDFVDYIIGRFAKRRCEYSANDTGCLSNAEIDNWAQKIGLVSVNKKFEAVKFNKYLPKVKGDDFENVPAGVAVMEMGRSDVLWYNPDGIELAIDAR
jgi:outer membrane murein-binding lipoprotein Lpp